MAKYKVVLMVDGNRLPTVQKEAHDAFKGDVVIVSKIDPAKSRADRLSEIEGTVQEAASDVQDLADEMQEWYDSLPENLQNSDKASELQDAIDALTELKDSLEGVDFSNVSFPGMMG